MPRVVLTYMRGNEFRRSRDDMCKTAFSAASVVPTQPTQLTNELCGWLKGHDCPGDVLHSAHHRGSGRARS
ncbi:protein of unknown function [Agreia sp. COWG]|nr:protein of unknown function [Agreia sp. COWG]